MLRISGILAACVALFLVSVGYGQNKKGDIQMGYSIGFYGQRAPENISQLLIDGGYNKLAPSSCSGGFISFGSGPCWEETPEIKKMAIHQFNWKYYLSSQSAINFVFGNSSPCEVYGYDGDDYLTIKNRIRYFSIGYLMSTKSGRASVHIAPTGSFQTVFYTKSEGYNKSASLQVGEFREFHLGLRAGLSFNIINKENFYLGIGSTVHILPKMSIGSYSSFHGNEFPQSSFNSNSIELVLSIGFKQ